MTLVVREADAKECQAAGLDPQEALRQSIARSDWCAVEFADGEEMCVWGYRECGFLTQSIDAWLLTSEKVVTNTIRFARGSKRHLDVLLSKYWAVRVEVHAAYTDSVKWLCWLGFKQVGVRVVRAETFLIMQKDRG